MVAQLVDDILAHAGVVHQTHKGGAQLHIGDVLHDVAAHTTVYLLDPAGVAPARDVGGKGVPLDVHKNGSDDYDSHRKTFLQKYFAFIIPTLYDRIHPFCHFGPKKRAEG